MNHRSRMRTRNTLWLISMALLLSLSSLSVPAIVTQEEDEDVRRTRDERRFKDARVGKRPSLQSMPPTTKKPGEVSPTTTAALDSELIGVTLWRLTPAADGRRSLSSAADKQDDTRILIPSANGQTRPYLAARVSDSVTFSNGELLWLGIEAPRVNNCYVYVIDREEYSDGTLGDPYLIFPAPTTPRGANIASAGRIVYVPSLGDPLPYFRLQRSNPAHVSERLTIIISPKQLMMSGHKESLEPGVELLKLDSSLVARWERQWGGKTRRLEARGSTGKRITAAEKEAGEWRRLVPTDPLPQTIYGVEAKLGQPVLVNLSLRIAP